MIKWGILGLGSIAKKFASDLQLVPGAKLEAVASRDILKAEANVIIETKDLTKILEKI